LSRDCSDFLGTELPGRILVEVDGRFDAGIGLGGMGMVIGRGIGGCGDGQGHKYWYHKCRNRKDARSVTRKVARLNKKID
jgi:hypothetical protein